MAGEQERIMEQQKANCPFCKIIKGDIPAKKVFENKKIIAVLDINPATEGHALVMPKEHYPIMPLIPAETFKELFSTAVRIADIEKLILLKTGTILFIANGGAAGQQSSHFMLHIIPSDKGELRQFNMVGNEQDSAALEKLYGSMVNTIRSRLKSEYMLFPIKDAEGNIVQLKQFFSREHVLNIIEQNPQLKEAIMSEPDQFKAAIPMNAQLKSIFENVDVDDIIRVFVPNFDSQKDTQDYRGVGGEGQQRDATKEAEEESTAQKERSDSSGPKPKSSGSGKDADLDLISRLF